MDTERQMSSNLRSVLKKVKNQKYIHSLLLHMEKQKYIFMSVYFDLADFMIGLENANNPLYSAYNAYNTVKPAFYYSRHI